MADNNAKAGTDRHHALEHVVDALIDLGEKSHEVAVDDAKAEIGSRSFGPFLFVPALLELSPVGGIPGIPTFLAIIVVITATQMMLGKREFWLPSFIGKRSVSGKRLQLLGKMRPLVRFMDKLIRSRFDWVLHRPWIQVIAALCIGCAFIVPPLELFPFASSIPFSAIALVGLGVIGKDGLLVLTGAVAGVIACTAVAITLLG